MRAKILQHSGIHNPSNLLQIQGCDDERERSASASTISFEFDDIPRSVIDDLDEIYSHRSHKQCMNLSYLTLLSMTLAVIYWIGYWLTYNRCEEFLSLQISSLMCKFSFAFEMLTFISLSFSPLFFILMIIFWMRFACQNPIDLIRRDFIGFRLEGDQWKNQLDYFSKRKSNICYFKNYKELINRNFGYIILSPHGIILDELLLLTSRKHILINGLFITNKQILKLEFKQCCKNEIFIYFPDELISQEIIEEFKQILKIDIQISDL